MNIYKLTLQYKGTSYLGFQVQSIGSTIQGELNNALKILSKSENIKSIGSGRTDSGVHAFAQMVRVEIPVDIPEGSLIRALNSQLPHDIRVSAAVKCNEQFHPIFSAKSKEYNYVFSKEQSISPFAHDLVTLFPYELDILRMQKGCELFCGEHDFINFQCTGTEVASTVRQIFSCGLTHYQSSGHWGHMLTDYYVFHVIGSGFLKQMVRLMMGALWSLGRGKIDLNDLERALAPVKGESLGRRLGATAPPQGLYLKEVHY
ncbi:MAG: tRNA pseudouridine(38-40) synthase TruA [Bacteriovorax sp.]|nr:tRNA pseudouridine(38-40) synthase TruA [Bacteriovorax sp.]